MPEVAVITGATGILGQTIARGFLAEGWTVACVSRSGEKARELETNLGTSAAKGAKVHGVVADLTATGGIDALVEDLQASGLMPTALLNFARSLDYLKVNDKGHPAAADWLRAFDLEVRVTYELSMACAEAGNSPLKSIINASSMYGVTTFNPNLYDDPVKKSTIQYAVVKAAVIHLTEEMAVRLAPGIRVNCISYGGVEGRVDDAFKQRYAKLCPSGRMLNSDDLAGPALFLATDASSGVTGHNLVVDGGWTIW